MSFFDLYLLSNHYLAPFLDLLIIEYTRDAKVDHLPVSHTCWDCLKEPKLTSNLIELELLDLGLGIQGIRFLL